MKFLTMATVKDVFRTLPQAEQKRFWEENIQWIVDVKKKMGDKLHFTAYPGGIATSALVNTAVLRSILKAFSHQWPRPGS